MEDWRARLKAARLTQRQLAQILGMDERTMSRQFNGVRGVQGYVAAAIQAWEIMDWNQRYAWIEQAQVLRAQEERERALAELDNAEVQRSLPDDPG